MWEQNPSPYYLNKQIVVLWIIRDTTCRKNCYPSKMATIKVVPLSSLGLSSPLLTFGCHFFSFAKRLPWFAMYSIYYCPNGGYLFIFFKKTEQGRGYLFFHLRKWKYSPVYYPQEKKALSLSTSSYFFHHYSFFYSWFVCFVVFFWKKDHILLFQKAYNVLRCLQIWENQLAREDQQPQNTTNYDSAAK